MAAPLPFLWSGNTGQIATPDEVQRQRAIANALYGQNATGATNWAEGLADVTAVLAGNKRSFDASEAEKLGMEKAGGLFSGLGSGSSVDQIAAALASPDAVWMSPGQSSVASALMRSQLDRQDPMNQLRLAQAQLDYDQDLAGVGSMGGSSMPSNVQEWEYYSQLTPEQQSQYLNMKRSNAPLNIGTGFVTQDQANPGTIIGAPIAIDNLGRAEQTAFGTGLGEQSLTTVDAGRNAASNNIKLDALEQTLATAPQGAQGGLTQLAGAVGVDLGGLSEVQAAQAIINQMVPLQRAPGSGTMSDADLDLFKKSLPSIINQPGANQQIIQTARAINDYTIAHAEIEQRYINGEITRQQAAQLKQQIPNPLESIRQQSAPAAATGVDDILKGYGL